MQKAEERVLNQVYALCMWGIILVHWQFHHLERIPAYGIAVLDILMQEHALVVFCLAGGYLQSRESDSGFMKNLVLYAMFIAWWRPLPQILSFLSLGSVELLEEYKAHERWYLTPRWFLVAMVFARTATSIMQLVRVPPLLQTGLSLSVLLGSQYMLPLQTYVISSEAAFILVGDLPCIKMPLVFFLHVASFHFLRRAVGQLMLGDIKVDFRLGLVLGVGLLYSIGASSRIKIFTNMEQDGSQQGTPVGVGWLLLELFASVTSSLLIVAACAYAPSRTLERLGRGSAVAYVLHAFFGESANWLCKTLLFWVDGSCGVFSGILSSAVAVLLPVAFMAVSVLVFDGLVRLVRIIPCIK
jgi:hypothetical protein